VAQRFQRCEKPQSQNRALAPEGLGVRFEGVLKGRGFSRAVQTSNTFRL